MSLEQALVLTKQTDGRQTLCRLQSTGGSSAPDAWAGQVKEQDKLGETKVTFQSRFNTIPRLLQRTVYSILG